MNSQNEPRRNQKKSVTQDLIDGFTELADALDKGEDLGPRFQCYSLQLELRSPRYSPRLVKATRMRVRASQRVFAGFLGVSTKTVSQWEQGAGDPSPIARRFMDEIRHNPAYYIARLRDSVRPKKRRKLKV
jgi:DNA-binding transcriptional regulator YiaG